MAAAPPLDPDQLYLAHLDKQDNQYALLRSSGWSNHLIQKLKSKNQITEPEANKIKSLREVDQYGRGLELLRILRSDPPRFTNRKKIAGFVAVFEHRDYMRPAVANVFSSYRDEHLKPT